MGNILWQCFQEHANIFMKHAASGSHSLIYQPDLLDTWNIQCEFILHTKPNQLVLTSKEERGFCVRPAYLSVNDTELSS